MLDVRHETTKPNAVPDLISFHVVHMSDKNSLCPFFGNLLCREKKQEVGKKKAKVKLSN